jgi:hypothetical protein
MPSVKKPASTAVAPALAELRERVDAVATKLDALRRHL